MSVRASLVLSVLFIVPALGYTQVSTSPSDGSTTSQTQRQPADQASTPTQAVQGQLKGNTFHYRGYRFDIGEVASNPAFKQLLLSIQQQVDLVESTALTENTKNYLRHFLVHVSEGEGEHGGNGHFSRDAVAVSLLPRQDDRPILLHEFMHAYQNERLSGGLRNPQVQMFYAQARSGMWPANAYMLKNVAEFFAMTTSTYLCGHAARPPFSRTNIEEKQPRYAEWLAQNLR